MSHWRPDGRAVARASTGALVAPAAGDQRHLCFRGLDQHQAHGLAQNIGVFAGEQLACCGDGSHSFGLGHRGASLVICSWPNNDDSRTLPVADASSALRSKSLYTTLEDSTHDVCRDGKCRVSNGIV